MGKRAKLELPSDPRLLREIIRQVCAEFEAVPKDLFRGERRKENLLRSMAVFLAREMSFSWRQIAAAFQERSIGATRSSYRRFGKYLKYIPGLSRKCEELKGKIIKKVDGS